MVVLPLTEGEMQYSQALYRARFRPGWLPSLAVAVLLPSFIGLGFWQLERAAQKSELLAAQASRRVEPPESLDAVEAQAATAYRRVRLRGYLDAAHSVLLDSRSHAGQVGVEVIQPFHDELSGRWVWLNRGWLAWPDRRVAVRFDTPHASLALTAWVHQGPATPFEFEAPRGEGWPRLVNRLEPAALWQALGRTGSALELRLEPGPAAFAVDWAVVASGPQRHYGYAAQWFAMAVALAAMFIYLGLHNAREPRR